jgi:hypothetical protein
MILSKDVLVNNVLTEISDNSTGQISPYDIRHNLLDIIDSVHLLTKGYPLDGANFNTRPTRSTRVGEDALSRLELAGHFSIDNTAVGHSALKANYQGIKNTAIGSHSLFCNVYGENNAALGYSSLGGNTVGYGNVGLGNYSLNNNKGGNFNIAIGNAAGYYANNVNNKLFIASHNIDSDYICDNPLGSGLTPLVYGDLESLKFGLAVNTLYEGATLQVSGNIAPAYDNADNLGISNYRFRFLYLSSGIFFDPYLYIGKLNSSDIQIRGHVVPYSHDTYDLGKQDNLWANAYVNNLYVSGIATLNTFTSLEHSYFFNKTINLASSGNISLDGGGPESIYEYLDEASPLVTAVGYLPDESLTGAGINVQSSGNGYLRTYEFVFIPPDESLSCLQSDTPYSRSSWNTNISLHLASGTHLKTDRIIFPSSINIVNSSGCFGLFSRGSGIFFSESEQISHTEHPSGYLAGVGDINFYQSSGNLSDYTVNISAIESGVNVSQRFLNGIKQKTTDPLNNDKENLRGFELQAIDASNEYIVGPSIDRFVIGSYDNTSEFVNAITLMRNDDSEGIFGITNLTPDSKNKLPETSLNVRSSTNAIGRFTAENNAETIAAIQLVGPENCTDNGVEIAYLNERNLTDINTYWFGYKTTPIRFYHYGSNNHVVGIFTSRDDTVPVGDMLTLGSSGDSRALISMYENTQTITARENHAKLYVKAKVRPQQSHSLYIKDDQGNTHDLVVNPYDNLDGRALYTDDFGNTFGGKYCPDARNDLDGCLRNTGLGSGVLFSISIGDDNSIFGTNAASGLTSGSRNSIFGGQSANTITTGNDNIVLGYNSFRNTSASINNNIVIGNSIGSGTNSNYNFIVGNNNITLLEGKLGPTNNDKYLSIPSGGKFLLNDSSNTDSLQLRANYIEVIDRGGNDYPNNTLTFSFNGNEVGELLYLNHAADPMTNSPVYKNPIPARPYAQLEGDLKLRGSIRFSDFTSLDSASFLNNINVVQSGLTNVNNALSSLIVEGYVNQQINAPTNSAVPTSGQLIIKNQNWNDVSNVTLVNRDTTSIIHSGAYIIAIKVNNEYKPLWISASDTKCQCCR